MWLIIVDTSPETNMIDVREREKIERDREDERVYLQETLRFEGRIDENI